MILADENVRGYIVRTFRDEGFEVVSVADTASGILFLRNAFHEFAEIR